MMEKKAARLSDKFRVIPGKGGGWPLKLVNSILQWALIDPLSLHIVPQGHSGGYIYIYIYQFLMFAIDIAVSLTLFWLAWLGSAQVCSAWSR